MRVYANYRGCRALAAGAVFVMAPALLAAQESFRVELGSDGETIADMRPVFLTYESRPMPAISPAEVARRYQRLFDSTDEPEVRIDALNRLANIQQASGQVVQPDDAEEQRLYREALGSYESVIERGSFHGKLDELLYQMAKAHAYVGQGEESIQRLKQLAGLYPGSPLVPEARFRIAESAFAAGQYAEAEAEYGQLIAGDGGDSLKTKARYMQGWSQYKQGAHAWRRAAASFLTVLDQSMPTVANIAQVSASDREVVNDTLRVLALMAADSDGASTLSAWLSESGDKPYDYLLFDRLADHYANRGQYADSVAVNRRYVAMHPDHFEAPAFLAQTVEVWGMAGEPARSRAARSDFVAAYTADSDYSRLPGKYQTLWQTFGEGLADFYYDQAEHTQEPRHFATAADYYERLSSRSDTPGETLRLAGDARLQAGDYDRALINYRQAAYHTDDYESGSDAAWAAITIQRDGVDNRIPRTATLQALSTEAEKFASAYQSDPRLPALNADLANRWLEQQGPQRARRFAETVHGLEASGPEERYSAWLVLGEVHATREDFRLAENAWREADRLIRSGTLTGVNADEAAAVRRQMATAVYRQGETAQKAGDTDVAVAHFQRVDSVLPGSDIAIKGRYDAANSLLLAERWQGAINEFTRFRTDFAAHPLARSISDKLVLAYSSSHQPIRAATELMAAAKNETDPWPHQLRAAELFHQGDAADRRDAIYREYLSGEPEAASAKEHVRLQTMRKRLVDSGVTAPHFRREMVSAELASEWHSEATLGWAAHAAMALGRSAAEEFTAVTLGHPLQQSLTRKQAALERARKRFAEAEQFDQQAVRAETLYRSAELYRVLARDLMGSAVPEELNDLERTQYRMLLEEEAYPFEEKAIALHARNHELLAAGEYSEWVEKSLQALAELFPGRYDREVQWMTWKGESNDEA
ncbi:MAG: tetratricopeptide repeat protein [Pseudomonadota bacterium]